MSFFHTLFHWPCSQLEFEFKWNPLKNCWSNQITFRCSRHLLHFLSFLHFRCFPHFRCSLHCSPIYPQVQVPYHQVQLDHDGWWYQKALCRWFLRWLLRRTPELRISVPNTFTQQKGCTMMWLTRNFIIVMYEY